MDATPHSREDSGAPGPGSCPDLRGHAYAALWLAGIQGPACREALGTVPSEQNFQTEGHCPGHLPRMGSLLWG